MTTEALYVLALFASIPVAGVLCWAGGWVAEYARRWGGVR